MDKKRIAAYIRLGKKTDDEESKRKEEITSLIEAREDCELTGIYMDAFGTSAMDPTRPEYVRLLADAEKNLFDYIVVKEFHEFSRDVNETRKAIERLRELGIIIYFLDIDKSSTTPEWDIWFHKASGAL